MKTIGIVMGGYSSEVEISIKSGGVVYKNLKNSNYQVYRIHILQDKWVVLDDNDSEYPINKHDFSTAINNEKIVFDCVFNAIHGTPGENGILLAYFELLGVKHTSAPAYQMALTFNKRDCLSVLKAYGIKSANSVFLNKRDEVNIQQIIDVVGLPCFVKPNQAGSSFGISKVNILEDLPNAIEKAYKEDDEILIESFLNGVEVSIGVIQFDGKTKVLTPTEIVTENEFFDYEAKYLGKSQEITPARISKEQLENLNKTAKKVYETLNMKGFSRSEFIFIDDVPYFLEINTVPGMTAASLLPQQASYAGISLTELFESAIEEALKGN